MPDIQKLNVNGTDFDLDDPNDVEKEDGELLDTVINYDSATTPTIGSFTAFLNQFVSGTKVGQWFKNFRAGCDFLLHIGSLVNNCVTDNEALPLAAAQGKVLMDLITESNSEITQLKSDLTELTNFQIITFNGESIDLASGSASDWYITKSEAGFADNDTILGIVGFALRGSGRSNGAFYTCYYEYDNSRFVCAVKNYGTGTITSCYPNISVLYIPA